MFKKVFSSFIIFVSVLSIVPCVSPVDEDAKPNLEYKILNDYEIEVNNINEINNVFFNFMPKGDNIEVVPESPELIRQITDNISIIINNETYELKFNKYDSNLYSFYVADSKGKNISISEDLGADNLRIVSNKGLSYEKVTVDTNFFFGKKPIGRKKPPFDCYIYLSGLALEQNSRSKEESVALANEIIMLKYNFKNMDEYVVWANRCSSDNLYTSLNVGQYSNYTPFIEGDLIYMKANLLTIDKETLLPQDENATEETSTETYEYLVTADPNQLSQDCLVYSHYKLTYSDDYKALLREPVLLKFKGKGFYTDFYEEIPCDVFEVIDPESESYKKYFHMLTEIDEIIKNPYKFLKDVQHLLQDNSDEQKE